MAPPSLGAFCRTIAIANIDEVTYVSDLPYDKVRDILRQVRSGSHLKLIEDASPQIKKHDAELWESLTRKEFPLQLKRMKKLNNDEDLVVDCWRTLNLKLRKEDDEREAQALVYLEKTLTKMNKTKEQGKANLANPKQLPKLPKETAPPVFAHLPNKYFGPSIKETPFQKVKKEADKVIHGRHLAIKARNTPTKALPTVPKGLAEVMRIRRQPLIAMRSDKHVDITDDSERTQREYEQRQKREERLLAAQKPKKASNNDDIHFLGDSISHSLQTILDDAHKPAPTTLVSHPPKAASPKAAPPPLRKPTNSLFTCPANIPKANSRIKLVPSTTRRPSTPSISANGLHNRPGSSKGLSSSASSPSGKSTTMTDRDLDDDDDLWGERDTTPAKPTTPGCPSKRRFSTFTGSTDKNITSTTTGPTSPESQPPRKKMKKTVGIFMPAKRAR